MFGFIGWLFGKLSQGGRQPPQVRIRFERAPYSPGEHRPSDPYFDTMLRMRAAISARDYEKAERLVRENLEHIPNVVKKVCREFGSFEIRSIPALEQGGTIIALVGNEDILARMREIVSSVPELEKWAEKVERHYQDLRLFQTIQELVAAQPNCLQTEVKGLIGEKDGRRVANLLSYLDKAGKIRRVKAGRTYRLLPPDSPDIKAAAPNTLES